MVYKDAVGKSIALMLWREQDDGEDDLAVFKGTLTFEDGCYHLDREEGCDRVLQPEWLARIDVVPPELKTVLLDCDYQLSLKLAELELAGGLEGFGFSWPEQV